MAEAGHRPTTQVDSEPDPATPIVADPSAESPPPLCERGDTIGRYVVVDLLGYGGMGVVYAAWDPQLDRRIALKLVTLGERSGGDSDGELHRLRLLREAQALARLEHPNVVKVHDVGVCPVGEGALGEQLFIAMEYVPGLTLREWLRARKRGLAAVLDVFVAAGRGLAAAHAAGLVHRDFKPDNVLVGEAGLVKVVDFGLARDSRADDHPRPREWAVTEPSAATSGARPRALAGVPEAIEPEPSAGYSLGHSLGSARSLFASAESITATGTVLGTPAYMAPEQHDRATVDARSDQYAFCVALWEAVYGKRPFAGRRSRTLAEHKRQLRIRESSRGLRVPRGLRSALLRGLSVAPEQRFSDMDALLTELERHLGKRRRALLPALGLGLGLAGLVAVIGSDRGPGRGAAPCAAPIERLDGVWDEARRAEVERALLASDLIYALDTWRRVAAGLDDYRARWLAAEVEVCEATKLRHEHDNAWLEQRLACLDERRRELASLTQQLARSDARTVEHAARAVGSLAPIAACERSESSTELTPLPADGHLQLRVERQLDRLADARAQLGSGHLAEGLAAAREVLASEPSREWPALAAEARFVIGNVVGDVEPDPQAASASLHAAAREALRGGYLRLAALSWSRLGRELIRGGELDRAEHWLGYAEQLAAALAREHDDSVLAADLEHTRAQLSFHRGDFAAAEAHARARLELLRGFYGPDSPRVADGLNNLGVAVYMQHRKDEAAAAYREALAILERVQGPDHPSVATMHNNIGVVSTDRGRYPEALVHYRRAVEIRERVFPRGHELAIQSLINLANVFLFSAHHGPGVAPALEAMLASGARLSEAQARAELEHGGDPLTAREAQVRLDLQTIPDYLRLGRLLAGTGQHEAALASFSAGLAALDQAPDARLPPGFVPVTGQPRPPHLDGCRADLLLGIEGSARALGRAPLAERAAAERQVLPVEQPAWPRRCLEELGGFMAARAP